MQTGQSKIQPADVFVIKEKLRPGDVILTMGDEKFSAGIASVTAGRYSHAILVASQNQWFEADDEGVGYSDCWGGGWLIGPGILRRVLALPNCLDAEVLSHPALKKRSSEDIESAIAKVVKPWLGEDYSDYRRLFNPLAVSGRPSWWIKLALAYYQWRDRRRPSGMFCSEVIARIYEALERECAFVGASLFGVARRADLVHPGHIAASRLGTVKDAVGYLSCLPSGMHVEWDTVLLDRRMPTRLARSSREFREYLAETTGSIRKQIASILGKELLWAACREHEIRKLIGDAKTLNAPNTLAKLERLLNEVEEYPAEIENYFNDRSHYFATYISLTTAQSDLALRIRSMHSDLLEESVPPDDPSHKEVLRIVLSEREAIVLARQQTEATLEEVRKTHKIPT